jgi:hypothetical protein
MVSSQSVSELKQSVQNSQAILERIANRARSLWQESQHSSSIPESIYESSDSVFEISSVTTNTKFDFDNDLLQSGTYQRALSNLQLLEELSLDRGDLAKVPSFRLPHAADDTIEENETATIVDANRGSGGESEIRYRSTLPHQELITFRIQEQMTCISL